MSDSRHIGETLFSARSLAEYRAMFALTDDDLTGSILDCPGGAASFAATAAGAVTAVDPLYALNPRLLADRARADTVRGHEFLRDPARAARFVWTFFADPAAHLAARSESAELFGRDLAARPERYIAAALPHLPFPDRSFDLALCSHFLFTYAERFDFEFHLAALLELARISRGEVRVFPVLRHVDGRPYEHLDKVRALLRTAGVHSEQRRVEYEFQLGGDKMLVLHSPPDLDPDPRTDNRSFPE